MASGFEILAVDLCSDGLKVVQMTQSAQAVVMSHWASAKFPVDADAGQVASALTDALREGGFTATSAIFGLPADRGFVQCRLPGESGSAKSPEKLNYVTDSWILPNGGQVMGVASRDDIARMQQIAALASLELVAVELRSVACLTALGILEVSNTEGPVLGIVADEDSVMLSLVDNGSPIVVQSRVRPEPRSQDVVSSITQTYRLAKISGLNVEPAYATVICPQLSNGALDKLQSGLGVPVAVGSPVEDRVEMAGGGPDVPADYAAAVGLGLEGLEHKAKPGHHPGRTSRSGSLNFLKLPAKRPKFVFTWRQAIALAAMLLVVIAVALRVDLANRQRKLKSLRGQYARREPELKSRQARIAKCKLLREYVSQANYGTRMSHSRVVDEVRELFPDKDEAYLTRLAMKFDVDQLRWVMTLTGHSSDSEVLYEFVKELSESKMFEKAELAVVDDIPETSGAFTKRFTITVVLEAGNNDASLRSTNQSENPRLQNANKGLIAQNERQSRSLLTFEGSVNNA